ncbi:MAG: TonB-dependent receptor [Pseudomonadota bacterium]|jgi:iron complex outermembrane receptor protein
MPRDGSLFQKPLAFSVVAVACLSGITPAAAQRASDNAVLAADDAFGVSVGRESIGLYTPDNVRGFSATDAGNARLDGLYFDPVRLPSARLQESTSIRVGIAAQGFAFPAPTGVVDYTLRHPGDAFKASAFASADTYRFFVGEADADIPIARGKLGIGVGVGAYRESYYNGTTDFTRSGALIARWRPTATLEVLPFWSQSDVSGSQAPPFYITSGNFLPPHIERRQFNGPAWAKGGGARFNYGGIVRWTPPGDWRVEAGVFRSGANDPLAFTNLFLNLEHDGCADQRVLVDPNARSVSTSGELRVSHGFSEGPRLHKLVLTLRGRDRESFYGGSAVVDLGEVRLGEAQTAPRPPFVFTTQDRDRIRQGTVGIGYEGRWKGVGEFSLSMQKTDYTKDLALAGGPSGRTRASPILYSAAVAAHVTRTMSVYASYTTGLEDSGSAPSNAVNRNEPLPAIGTRQADAGVRWAITGKLKLIVGVFDLRKPYFQLDAANRYSLLGQIDNKGIEVSLSGAATPRLDIVAGAVVSDPRVSGDAVRLGFVGSTPVDKPGKRFEANANWRPPGLDSLTFELGVTYVGRRAATTDDAVYLPSRTLVDLGARYAFKLAGSSAQLRLAITNIGNVYGFDLYGAGNYDTTPGRVAQVSLGVDF